MIDCNVSFIKDLSTTRKTKIINISEKSFLDKYGEDYNLLAKKVNSDRSTVNMYQDWYILEDGYYYFKYNFLFAELLMSELAKEFNIKCVEFFIAKSNGIIGVISKNFRDECSKYYNAKSFFTEFNLEKNKFSIFEKLSLIENSFSLDSYTNTCNSLFRLLAFDFFSGQKDRGYYNLYFKRNNGLIELSPLTDNGACFRNCQINVLHSIISHLYFANDEEVTPDEFQTLELIINNEEFRKYLLLCLDIDIDLIIRRTLKKYELTMYEHEKYQIIYFFDKKKEVIDKTLSLIKKS